MDKCPNCNEKLKGRNIKICPHCGIELFNLNKNDNDRVNKFDEKNDNDEINDLWLMTDKIALANIKFQGRLEDLKQDIKFNVMRGELWHAEDLAYIEAINGLINEGIIEKTTSYWFTSPFPPIYKAIHVGKLKILGKKYAFDKGDEIVWQCQMGREMYELEGPVLIGKFTPQKISMLCKEMENATKGSKMIILR